MNKINIDNNINKVFNVDVDTCFNINSNNNSNITLWLEDSDLKLEFNILDDSNIIVNILNIDSTIEFNVNFVGENSKLLLNNSIIAYNDTYLYMSINNVHSNCESLIYNHGVNVNDNILEFHVDAKIDKNADNCILNQDNKIINMNNGRCLIRPNLLVDEYNSVANHAAYISKFKKEDLFYLMSRGISLEDANRLLIKSFLLGKMDLEQDIKSRFIDIIYNI